MMVMVGMQYVFDEHSKEEGSGRPGEGTLHNQAELQWEDGTKVQYQKWQYAAPEMVESGTCFGLSSRSIKYPLMILSASLMYRS